MARIVRHLSARALRRFHGAVEHLGVLRGLELVDPVLRFEQGQFDEPGRMTPERIQALDHLRGRNVAREMSAIRAIELDVRRIGRGVDECRGRLVARRVPRITLHEARLDDIGEGQRLIARHAEFLSPRDARVARHDPPQRHLPLVRQRRERRRQRLVGGERSRDGRRRRIDALEIGAIQRRNAAQPGERTQQRALHVRRRKRCLGRIARAHVRHDPGVTATRSVSRG